MRSARHLLAVLLLTATGASASAAVAQTQWSAALNGANQVPPVATPGTGTFDATLSADQTSMTFTLIYRNLLGAAAQAHVHRGAAGTNGGLLYFLSPGPFASPLTGRTDPAPAGGPLGFDPSDFSDLQAGRLYVDVQTAAFPSGEIRGQIVSAVVVGNATWGRMKALYH